MSFMGWGNLLFRLCVLVTHPVFWNCKPNREVCKSKPLPPNGLCLMVCLPGILPIRFRSAITVTSQRLQMLPTTPDACALPNHRLLSLKRDPPKLGCDKARYFNLRTPRIHGNHHRYCPLCTLRNPKGQVNLSLSQ